MKKLLFFIWSLKMGGSEKACITMANALADKYDVTIGTVFGDGVLRDEVGESVRVVSVFPRFIRGLSRLCNYIPPQILHKLFIRDKYDVEIAVGDGLESHVISGSNNDNIYSWIHMDLRYHGHGYSQKTLRRFGSFKKILCVSRVCADAFNGMFNMPEKTAVLYTPVDEEKLQILSDADTAYPAGEYCVCVGRLEEVKGYDRLIAAWKNSGTCIPLYIYGDGTKRRQLEEQINGLGLSDRVFLPGSVKNPYPYIKNAKALICSSLDESFGFTLIEAMLLGTPVLATRCGGAEEIIAADDIGILCDNSTEGLTSGIGKILADNNCIDIDAAKARAREFNIPSCTDKFIAAIS